jgi:hypothetical protein
LKTNVSVALEGTHYHSFVALVAASFAFHSPTDERFVHLYDTLEKLCVNLFKGGAYAVREVPGGFIGDPKCALELVSRNALLGLYDKIDC